MSKSIATIQAERADRVRKYGSPYYRWTVPATAAGAQTIIEVSRSMPETAKYSPLDELEILNNDVVDVTLYINANESFEVPAGSVRRIEGRPLWQIGVKNNHAATTSALGKIVVTMRAAPMDADRKARGL